jgi:hypothetical protein
MKQILAFLSAIMLLTLVSCNNNEPPKEETKTTSEATPTTAKVTEPPAFQPFTITLIQHKVKDFDKWLPQYEAHDSARKANGLTDVGVGRGLDNKNEVVITLKTDDIQKAKDFSASPGLKEAMQKGGVTGAPSISYITVIRDDNSTIEQKDRLLVSHHVKDFDTWLKAFDSEGKGTRAGYGLIDRGIARGIDDPNKVYVLFAVSDIAKAKARSGSPELKKLMTDAGVDGPPTITFFKLVK